MFSYTVLFPINRTLEGYAPLGVREKNLVRRTQSTPLSRGGNGEKRTSRRKPFRLDFSSPRFPDRYGQWSTLSLVHVENDSILSTHFSEEVGSLLKDRTIMSFLRQKPHYGKTTGESNREGKLSLQSRGFYTWENVTVTARTDG